VSLSSTFSNSLPLCLSLSLCRSLYLFLSRINSLICCNTFIPFTNWMSFYKILCAVVAYCLTIARGCTQPWRRVVLLM
jgi:hypothetical protein